MKTGGHARAEARGLLTQRDEMRGRTVSLLLSFLVIAAPVLSQTGRAGWDALQRGDAARAAAAFREALAIAPDDPALHLGAGTAAHRLGRDDQARAELTRALDLEPRLWQAAVLLGQVAYAQGDLDAAIGAFEQARALLPNDVGIARQLAQWKKEADLHGGFAERVGEHFRILFEGPQDHAVAAHVERVLESAYWRVGRWLDAYPAEPITVILYTKEHFRDVTRVPAWSTGAFDGRIRIPVEGALDTVSDLDRVVVHEFVHAVVRDVAPRGVPAWLNEGLASHLEPGDRRWVHDVLSGAELIPLSHLDQGFAHLDGPQAAVAYAESELAVRILAERLGASLPMFLHALGNGQSVEDELSLFDISLEEVRQEMVRRLRGPRVPGSSF